MKRKTKAAIGALHFDDAMVALATGRGFPETPHPASSPLLRALRGAGTAHIYADTASLEELRGLVTAGEREVLAEIDGNTANQPLVAKVLEESLEHESLADWAKALREHAPELSDARLLPVLYAVVCGRLGNDIVRHFAGHRSWQVSLQLHMALVDDPAAAQRLGRNLRRMVASTFVKVPFAPHAPHTLLVARNLEREYVPVNFTSTFSARQVVVATLLCDVARTNVFLGRLNQGLQAKLLGEHVLLEAQRSVHRLRDEPGAKTQLIAASLRDWWTIPRTAGCDVYTAPCEVLHAFLAQDEVGPEDLESRLETSYEDRLGVAPEVEEKLGRDTVARLWTVEPELVDFLLTYRASEEYRSLEGREGGELLARRFEEAGFGDFFFAPGETAWQELRESKLPDLDAPLTHELALDTHYSLRADADFAKQQEAMDAILAERLRAS